MSSLSAGIYPMESTILSSYTIRMFQSLLESKKDLTHWLTINPRGGEKGEKLLLYMPPNTPLIRRVFNAAADEISTFSLLKELPNKVRVRSFGVDLIQMAVTTYTDDSHFDRLLLSLTGGF
jgi:hypothetical protein